MRSDTVVKVRIRHTLKLFLRAHHGIFRELVEMLGGGGGAISVSFASEPSSLRILPGK